MRAADSLSSYPESNKAEFGGPPEVMILEVKGVPRILTCLGPPKA